MFFKVTLLFLWQHKVTGTIKSSGLSLSHVSRIKLRPLMSDLNEELKES